MDKIFDHEAFQLQSLVTAYDSSTAIEMDVYNMFEYEPVESRTVQLVKSGSELQVLLPGEIGNNPNIDTHDAENSVPVNLIRFPFENAITPDDVTRIESIKNKKVQAQELATLVKSKVKRHKDNHLYTSVYSAYSALKGIIRDRKGNALANLFTVFGIEARSLNLKLSDPAFDLPKALQEFAKTNRELCKKYGMLVNQGTIVRWGSTNIHKMVTHASLTEFFGEDEHGQLKKKWSNDPSQITLFGVTFIADEMDAVSEEGASFPNVPGGLFAMLRAPADVISGGAKNRECHITKELKKHNEGLEIRSRAIYLPVCKNPHMLCNVVAS
ncbi:TPA: major capsid protein [Vibrio parahaemolyticus]